MYTNRDQAFAEAYTKLLVAVWTDEQVAQRLKDDPRAVAADAGLVIPLDVEVLVVEASGEQSEDPQAELAAYHADFLRGIERKSVQLVIPQAPPIGPAVLTGEELAEVAGGIGCCCCPCSCCCG